jgi:ATP-binding cassette subfamily B protein
MPQSPYRLLVPYLRPQWPTIAQALGCTALFTLFWPILAWLAGEIAGYIGAGNTQAIAQWAGVGAIAFLVRGMAQYGQDALMAKAALHIAYDVRCATYAHLHRLSLSYFQGAKTGDLAYRLTEDVDRLGEAVNKVFHQFVPCVLQLIVVLGYMVYLNWQLTLASAVIAPLMAVLIGWFGDRLTRFARRSQDRISNLSAIVAEVFAGMRLVQAFAAEGYEVERFGHEADQSRRAKYRAEQTKAAQFVIVGFLQAMSVLLLFWLGGWQIAQGNLTGNGFVSYVAAVAMLIDPIAITTSNYNEFKESEASAERLQELLILEPSVTEAPGAIALPPARAQVAYRQVTFSYPSSDPSTLDLATSTPTIQNLSFTAEPGEAIALVGASGAGKTTLVNLLPRFYDPQGGEIAIDGVNIRHVSLNSLRHQIGIVPQETLLFSGTIAQNIAFGRKHFNLAEVEKAARIANAHDFISAFPEGYHTWVGERGTNLSGGQRQRIAIARAVLLNPRILILDEATSALDSESEALVQQALERLMQGRTVFIIAHRLATVRRADRILVLEQGQIVEAGTHDQLLAQGGRYAAYYAQQFRE